MVLLAVVCACARPARGALTVLTRETFQGVGTLNAAAPGNLGTVNAGSFFKRPVGPRLSGDTSAGARGWSADIQRQFDASCTASGGGAFPSGTGVGPATSDGIYAYDFWLYLAAPVADGASGVTLFVPDCYSGQELFHLSVYGTAFQYTGIAPQDGTARPYSVTLGRWTQVRFVWTKLGGSYYFDYNCALLVRVAGSNQWTELYNSPAPTKVFDNLYAMQTGFQNNGAQPFVSARWGMPSFYRLDAWTDRTALVAGVVDPPAGPFDWYVDPVSGNDNNDGTSPASAWQNVAKINTESANLGLLPTAAGYAHGDTLHIDTTRGNLLLGPVGLQLQTRGLNVVQTGGGLTGTGELQAWTALPASSWSLVANAVNTYQSTLTESNPCCVLWENDEWLNHPTGSTLSAVFASLESTPGSFWTDGTTMYAHPFGNTNPASDGKTYTRSYHRGAPFGGPAVNCLAADLHLSGLRVRKTCLADPSTNDPVAAYCYQTQGQLDGTMLVENCYGAYGSKHVFGFTDNSLTRQYTAVGCQAEQGSPYVGAGGQTPWVDYANNPGSNGTATTAYLRCTTLANAGLIGSAAGQYRPDIPVWISHNSGQGALQFASCSFTDCNLAGGLSTGVTAAFRYTRGSCRGGSFGPSTAAVFTGVDVPGGQPFTGAGTVTVRNCVIAVDTINDGFEPAASGTVDYEGNTVDLSATTSNNDNHALFARSGPLNFTWRDNLLIGSTAFHFGVLRGAQSTDPVSFDHNAYQNVVTVAYGYNDGTTTADRTLAQWQALGEDAGSFAVADPLLDSRYLPALASPLTDAGADLGNTQDYTGRTFLHRRTIGALEPLSTFARWQTDNFTAREISLPQVSGPNADPDGDGLSNLLEYALRTNPKSPGAAPTAPGVQRIGGQPYLTLSYPQLEYSADLLYVPEVSSDLLTWQSGSGQTVLLGSVDNGDGTETVFVRDAQPLGANPRRFLRLRVTVH